MLCQIYVEPALLIRMVSIADDMTEMIVTIADWPPSHPLAFSIASVLFEAGVRPLESSELPRSYHPTKKHSRASMKCCRHTPNCNNQRG